MAKKATPADGEQQSTNLTGTKQVIRDCVKGLVAIDESRAELSEQAAELRERCRNHGILPAALNLAIKMAKMESEDREKLDESYAIARDALGIGMQGSLFDMIKTPDDQAADTTL